LVVTALKAFSAAARASGSRRVFGVSRQSLDRSRESSLPMTDNDAWQGFLPSLDAKRVPPAG
jgi:hypothetical protein